MTDTRPILVDYKKILKDFLDAREWTDELEVDQATLQVSLGTGIDIGSQSGRLIIEADCKSAVIDVYIYYELKCKEAKLDQLTLLLNGIHQRWAYGRFVVFPSGQIRWQHRVDFEDASPTGNSINNIVRPGWEAVGMFADVISAVALTKQTAEEALAEYDEAMSDGNSSDDEAPSEL